MKINLSEEQIIKAIPKISIGLKKYSVIQNGIEKSDLTKDIKLQTLFNHFYRLRMKVEHRSVVYKLIKQKETNYRKVLSSLKKTTGRVEKSFASKVVATSDTGMPVIDSVVLKNINAGKVINEIDEVVNLYSDMQKLYSEFLDSKQGKFLVKEFDKYYKNNNLTSVKKLDFVLWQTRNK